MTRLLPRGRVVAMTAILVATGFSWNIAPRPLPAPGAPASAPLPLGLGPRPVDAAYCATPNPTFTGYLTQQLIDSGAPTITNRTTSGTVYGYVSNVDGTWACTLHRRYDGVDRKSVV